MIKIENLVQKKLTFEYTILSDSKHLTTALYQTQSNNFAKSKHPLNRSGTEYLGVWSSFVLFGTRSIHDPRKHRLVNSYKWHRRRGPEQTRTQQLFDNLEYEANFEGIECISK